MKNNNLQPIRQALRPETQYRGAQAVRGSEKPSGLRLRGRSDSRSSRRGEKGFSSLVVIVIIILMIVVLGAGYYLIIKQSETISTIAQPENVVTENEQGEVMTNYSGTVLAGTSAPLLDFTKADYDTAIKSDKVVVLYFYANWCPICIAEFPVMQKVFNELSADKVIGFRVNYNDNQTDNDEKNLAKEFGVAYQHTKVFVKNGQRVLKSPEGWEQSRYLREINNFLN